MLLYSLSRRITQQQGAVALSLTAAIRRNATNASAAAAAGVADSSASASPATPAEKATPRSWSVYCPPTWRLVGNSSRRALRELDIAERRLKKAEAAVLRATTKAEAAGNTPESVARVEEAKKKVAEAQSASEAARLLAPILGHAADKEASVSGAANVPAPSPSPATTYFFHGSRLGPRPIVVLDEVIPHAIAESLFAAVASNGNTGEGLQTSGERALSPLKRYEALLNDLNHKHGALSLPLVGPKGCDTAESLAGLSPEAKLQFFSNLCDDVITMLDVLHIQHATIIARSTGALLALKLAALYPERVGGIVVCDTPLLSKHWVNNNETRKEILKAAEDVNVPRADLEFAVRSLLESGEGVEAGEGLEPALAVPFTPAPPAEESGDDGVITSFNKAIYEEVIFSKDLVFPKQVVVARHTKEANFLNDNPLFGDIAVGPNAATAAKYLGTLCAESEAAATADISIKNADVHPGTGLSSVPIVEGLYRSDKAYLAPESIAAIRHPMLFVQPSANAIADGTLHKNVLNLRKPTVINLAPGGSEQKGAAAGDKGGKGSNKKGKDAKSQTATPAEEKPAEDAKKSTVKAANSIFDAAVSSAFAKQIAAFTNRFELDVNIAKRFEQTAADLVRNMNNAQSVGGVSADEGGAKGKGKGKAKAKK